MLEQGPAPSSTAKPKPKPRWLRPVLITSQVLLGLGLGLGVAEWAFTARAEGAFPHVNFYVADPELGVRLEPGAHMRFRLRDNPLTEINVNRQGYRGADWPSEAGSGEILVVGDSQVFGLGVGDDETFSAELARATGRTVLNAGVPTYGPGEYLAVTQEILEQRGPDTVIYVINFLNDSFELDRPNTERHTVWDGWAVRSETAPAKPRQFPGRHWLFSRSHLVYAVRRWWHESNTDVEADDAGVPSEGGWEDLIADGARSIEHVDQATTDADAAVRQRRERLTQLELELDSSEAALAKAAAEAFEDYDPDAARLLRHHAGDIVVDRYSEAARKITVTAQEIRRATKQREAYVKRVLDERKADELQLEELLASDKALSAEQERIRAELLAGDERVRMPSVFEPHLAELAELCERHGAELIVVALPVDVQVSASEWAKYGVDEAPDMTPSLALLDDLVASVEATGGRALDATPALRAAEPGAFLDGDIHMTPKGHAALAAALVPVLAGEPTLSKPSEKPPAKHAVVAGDSLWKLAKAHGCTVEALAEHNAIDPDATLPIGVELDLSICEAGP